MDVGQQTSQLLPALRLDGPDGKFGVGHHLQHAVISLLVDDAQLSNADEVTDGATSCVR